MKTVVALDADGVLLNFNQAYLHTLGKITGKYFNEEEINHWDVTQCSFFLDLRMRYPLLKLWMEEQICRKRWAGQIPAYPEAVAAVRKLKDIADVRVVTAPWLGSRHWMYERARALQQLFDLDARDICFATDKTNYFAHVFVDDKPSNVIDHMLQWPKQAHVLFLRNYNRETPTPKWIKRSDSWDEIIELVSAVYGERP